MDNLIPFLESFFHFDRKELHNPCSELLGMIVHHEIMVYEIH